MEHKINSISSKAITVLNDLIADVSSIVSLDQAFRQPRTLRLSILMDECDAGERTRNSGFSFMDADKENYLD